MSKYGLHHLTSRVPHQGSLDHKCAITDLQVYDAHTTAILKNLCIFQINGICLHAAEIVKIMFLYKTGLLPDIIMSKTFPLRNQAHGCNTRNSISFHKCKTNIRLFFVSTKVPCFLQLISLLFYVAVYFLFQLIFVFPLFWGMVMYSNEFKTKIN